MTKQTQELEEVRRIETQVNFQFSACTFYRKPRATSSSCSYGTEQRDTLSERKKWEGEWRKGAEIRQRTQEEDRGPKKRVERAMIDGNGLVRWIVVRGDIFHDI